MAQPCSKTFDLFDSQPCNTNPTESKDYHKRNLKIKIFLEKETEKCNLGYLERLSAIFTLLLLSSFCSCLFSTWLFKTACWKIHTRKRSMHIIMKNNYIEFHWMIVLLKQMWLVYLFRQVCSFVYICFIYNICACKKFPAQLSLPKEFLLNMCSWKYKKPTICL